MVCTIPKDCYCLNLLSLFESRAHVLFLCRSQASDVLVVDGTSTHSSVVSPLQPLLSLETPFQLLGIIQHW